MLMSVWNRWIRNRLGRPAKGMTRFRLGMTTLEDRTVPAFLVADINQTLIAPFFVPTIGSGSTTPTIVVVGGTGYFVGNDNAANAELWKTDGTLAGTTLVKDINPTTFSSAANLTNVNGTLYFTASNGVNGNELWKSDGTAVGTVMVQDLVPGSTGSSPKFIGINNGELYFWADTSLGTALYRTDPAEGVKLVKDLNPTSTTSTLSSAPVVNRVINGILYFVGTDGATGLELWRTDGSEAGTYRVKDIRPGINEPGLTSMVAVGSTLFFSANDGTTNSTELWKSDGTEAGTELVKDINPAAFGASTPTNLTAIGSTLFFRASNGTATGANGAELWMSDGSAAGTVMVADINPGTASGNPANFTHVNGTLYFTATEATSGTELWKYVLPVAGDPTTGIASRVADINPGTASASPANLTVIGSTLYFTANDGTSGIELYKTDGTTLGTVRVDDINVGTASSTPTTLTVVGSKLYFTATTAASGSESYVYDGTSVSMLADFNTGATNSTPTTSPIIVGLNAKVLTTVISTGFDNGTRQLAVTDGSAAGTMLIQPPRTNTVSSSPANTVVAGGYAYFTANDGVNGVEIWRSNGTADGTTLVKDLTPGSGSSPLNMIGAVGNLVYFSFGSKLWVTDGTDAGTKVFLDVANSPSGFLGSEILSTGNRFFFSAVSGTRQLWSSDGTADGTFQVSGFLTQVSGMSGGAAVVNGRLVFGANGATSTGDPFGIYSTTGVIINGESDLAELSIAGSRSVGVAPSSFTVMDGYVYFWQNTSDASTNGIYRTDGLSAPVAVKLFPNGSNNAGNNRWTTYLDPVDNVSKLLIPINDGVNGIEVWKSDGTEAGTVLVKDINPGTGGIGTSRFVPFNGEFYFSANDGTNGQELWKTDGTTAGTVLVKDVLPGTGPGLTTTSVMGVSGGKLYFAANNGVNGVELWSTDGSTAGTVLDADLFAGVSPSTPANGFSLNDNLYFSANNGTQGVELFRASAPVAATTTTLTGQAGPVLVGNNLTFTATITPANGAPAPTGTVTYFIDGVPQSPVPVSTTAGVTTAAFSTDTLTAGTHSIVAVYNGDSNNAASITSPPFSQTIYPAGTPTVSTVTMSGFGNSGNATDVAPAPTTTLSRLTSLTVNFSTNVDIAAGAFTLSNGTQTITSSVSGGIFVGGNQTTAANVSAINLTFDPTNVAVEFGSLADGTWTLTIDPSKITGTSNSVAMVPFTPRADIRRLFGDVNGDGFVDGSDESDFGSTFGLESPANGFLNAFDINGDGFIDGTDESAFGSRFGTQL